MSREVINIYQACKYYSSKDGSCSNPYLGRSFRLVDEMTGRDFLINFDQGISTKINPASRRRLHEEAREEENGKLYCGAPNTLTERNPSLIGQQILCWDYSPERELT